MDEIPYDKRYYRLTFRRFPSFFLVVASFFLWLFGPESLSFVAPLFLLSIIVTVWHVFRHAKFPSFFTWFALPYAGLFLLYPVAAPLLGAEMPAAPKVLAEYCLLTVGGLHLFILGYEFASPPRAQRHWNTSFRTTSHRLHNMLLLLLLLNLAAVALVLRDAGGLSMIRSQTRLDMKETVGILTTIAVLVFGFGSLLYPLVAVHVRRRPRRAFFWVPVVIGLEIFLFLAFRVRTFPVVHGIALLVGWFLIAPRLEIDFSKPRSRRRLTAVQKGILLFFACNLVLAMFVLRTFRGQFQAASSISDIQIDLADSVLFAFEGGGELGYSKWVFQVLEIVPERFDYLYGQSYYRLLFAPVPRIIWPEKPQNTQRVVAQWINEDSAKVQTTPVGIIGDLYVNFGMWGVLGMFIFGYAFGLLDIRNGIGPMLLMSVSFAMIFHLARGAFTNPILNLVVYYVITRYASWYLCGKFILLDEPRNTSVAVPTEPDAAPGPPVPERGMRL